MERLRIVGLVAGTILAVGGAVATLYRGARAMWRVQRRVGDFLTDWFGEPARPGVPERPGVMQQLAMVRGDLCELKQRVSQLEQEVPPNSGRSMRDQVAGIARKAGVEVDGS